VNFAEQQARCVAAQLAGEYVLPGEDEMRDAIAQDEARDIGSYYRSRRHTQQVNFDIYCADLEREMARGKRRAGGKARSRKVSA
jgi:hypothetical protein